MHEHHDMDLRFVLNIFWATRCIKNFLANSSHSLAYTFTTDQNETLEVKSMLCSTVTFRSFTRWKSLAIRKNRHCRKAKATESSVIAILDICCSWNWYFHVFLALFIYHIRRHLDTYEQYFFFPISASKESFGCIVKIERVIFY